MGETTNMESAASVTNVLVFEPFVTMGKYSAHKGMVNPMDSLSIEVSIDTLKMINAKYGGYKYRVANNPDWTGIRIYPGGGNGFSHRDGGKAALRITDANNSWLKSIPAFTSTRCEVQFFDKHFDVFIPELRKPPIQKNRTGEKAEAIMETVEVVAADSSSAIVTLMPDQIPARRIVFDPKPAAPTKKVELFAYIDKINEAKREFGDSMLLTISKDGFLKVMIEHGVE